MKNAWEEQSIGSLKNKVIIVTGSNSGLGYEAAKIFAQHGATVIMAVRSIDKGTAAKEKIMQTVPTAVIKVMALDLADLNSIKHFTEQFKKSFNRLDILMNNAGIMWCEYSKTKDGFERQFGTNHLGHFALTAQLFDVIRTTKNARIVNTSSLGHKAGVMDFDNLMFKGGKDYTKMKAYGRSKLANLLFTYELERRVEKAGLPIKVLAAHPGASNTNLARYVQNKIWFKLSYPILLLLSQNAHNGALPEVRAALDPAAEGGTYYGPSGFGESRGKPVVVQSNKASHNEEDARRLWEVSEKLTGIKFIV